MKRLLFLCLLLALPASAAEDDWIFGCAENATFDLLTAPTTTKLIPGEVACAESITQTNVTSNLDVGACEYIDVYQWPDADGDADVSTVVGQPQLCPNSQDDDQSCDEFGLAEFAADAFVQGLGARWFRMKSAGTTDTAPVRWEVHCMRKGRL
ncbi:MAG: hypothetical protein V3S01_09330 [Dehalococcoidia bacterium]